MAGLQLVVAVATCLIALGVPGAAIGLTLRLRGMWLLAAVPVLSFSVVCIAAVVAPPLGLRSSTWAVVAVAAIVVLVAWTATRLLKAPAAQSSTRPTWRWATPIAAGTGIALMLLRTLRGIPSADLFAQSFDNAFHLAAARFIVETGSASPWAVSRLGLPEEGSFFYPTGWHALVALVAEASGSPVTVASNACLIVVACVAWPLGVVLLTRTLFGSRTPLLIAAGAASAGFATYPFLMIVTMGTYPLVASIALVPATAAAAVALVGLGSASVSRRIALLTLIASAPALALVHPSSLVMLAVLSVPIAIVAAVVLARRRPDHARLVVLSTVLYGVLVVVGVLVFRTAIDQPDSPRSSVAQALGEVATSAFGAMPIPIVIAATTIIGVVAALRRRRPADWVGIGMWAAVATLYVGTAGGDEFLHLVLGGPWYSDATRIAAFTPIVIAPLAALGASACWTWLTAWVRRRGAGRRALQVAVVATAVAAFAAALVQSAPVRGVDASLRAAFTPTDNALTSLVGVGPDERKLVRFIEQTVPEGDVIANNPRDASGFIYPLTGRRLLTPYMLTAIDNDREVFYAGIANAESSDAACEIAQRLGVRWVVEFHPDQVLSSDGRFVGIKGISNSANVELVKRFGASSLYRITGCGFGAE
ncbi:hypothetical protein J2X03_003204 [Microbacterium trichothecenolyticum]|uniref:DUF6541 family protein n=1 Tax=Microbacterium trichothecenolyticum TaxID=69370 RepID=UPI002854D6A4|nr:DUF6541 family protein [Microbacterium trichothecenolyticum]MDR7113307.1 hypothetical protein [Microbacterium trichothecenolyticum]